MSAAKPFPILVLLAVLAAAGTPGTTRPASAVDLLLVANRDDDDRDGTPDADDERVNGETDLLDLGAVTIPLPEGTSRVRLATGDAPLRFFRRQDGAWRHLGRGDVETAVGPADGDELEVFVEASSWVGLPAAWTGAAVVRVTREGAADRAAPLEIPVVVAPVRLLPATAPVEEVYVATGRYDNAAFVKQLRAALDARGVPLREHPTRDWREMWMQDTMEIGVAATPRSSMHVVLAGLRGSDTFPPTLLGPDVAVAEVASPRTLTGGDAWADWYGNLEVSTPTAAYPAGRVISGLNLLTDCGFHPDAVAFLAAQRFQPLVWIDTSWLLIKHVDEIVSFLPGRDGLGVILVPDPEEGLRLLAEGRDSAGPDDARRREANARIARRIAAMLSGSDSSPRAGASGPGNDGSSSGLLDLLGLDERRVVRLPVAFDVPPQGLRPDGGVTDASSLWSNPVNALVVNGTVICGSAGMPDAVRQTCRERFLEAGATAVEFIDDGVYQKNHGNVHCATNARRCASSGSVTP